MATEKKRLSPLVMAVVVVVAAALVAGLALWVGTARGNSARNPTAGMTVEQAQQKLHEMMQQQKGK